MSIPLAVCVPLTVVLILIATIVRLRSPASPLTFEQFPIIVVISVGLSLAVAYVDLPIVWAFVSVFLQGGTIDKHLPPGSDINSLFLTLMVGAIIGTGWALKTYIDKLRR